MIRQHILLIRGWCINEKYRNVLPDPGAFADREAAQAAVQDWCEYLLKLSAEKGSANAEREGKWDHVWVLIKKHGAAKGIGEDPAIANEHNSLCASRIKAGSCEAIDAEKVAQIRYEQTHPDRHRK